MRVGVVSDTHGDMGSTESAVELLARQNVEVVLHCGDIGSTSIIPLFDRWPTHFVFGNVDGNESALRQAIAVSGQHCHERFGELELDGVRVAILHSDDDFKFRSTIGSGEFDLVCYGHTHVAKHERRGTTEVLNPGALHRAEPRTIAIVELPEMSVEHLTVDRR